ncbi:hypothetical protein CL684_01465 [Candidatus Campbellbacteria bacterium]|nr:hypothetical protein [Candidatus Campbellbacteria bacterium]|tara:strand:- start:427 stop:753 length:327 start_codon:yes stop_codon:yes gene_type:complete
MSSVKILPKLDAYKTQKGNYFVIFHEFYGAYFNGTLDSFMGENPVRVEVEKEEGWIKCKWGTNSKIIELDEVQSERVIALVEEHSEHGLADIRQKVEETYREDMEEAW